ncbi:hypothetical protein D3C86_2108820 [compost metagenome]
MENDVAVMILSIGDGSGQKVGQNSVIRQPAQKRRSEVWLADQEVDDNIVLRGAQN